MLRALGIAVPKGFACESQAEALSAFRALTKPVVLKLSSVQLAHKTDVGGVELNIEDEAGLRAALSRLDRVPLGCAPRYLLEEMAPPGLELVVGALRDSSFGPSVMLGAGGTLAEVLKDTTSRLAPLSLLDAEDMLGELRIAPLFAGFRGRPRSTNARWHGSWSS